MQEIPGKAQGSLCYIHEGYLYHIDTTHDHICRCSTRSSTRCRGAVRVNDQGQVEVYREHSNHEANPSLYSEIKMKNEMLDLAASTNTALKDIFDNVCREYTSSSIINKFNIFDRVSTSNPRVAPKLNYSKLKNAMDRARSKGRPAIPQTLRELATALDTYDPVQAVYRGLVEGEDGSVALVFASAEMLLALGKADEMYIDGTFKVTPNHPPIAQLFTLHIRVNDTGIAAVFILCSARTRALYDAIFTKIKTDAPDLVNNLKFVMGNYERATMRALRNAFPAANLHGCWFHFTQALWRYWRRLGLSNAPKTILSLAMALPLAPVNRFDEGLVLLRDLADEIGGTHPPVLQFMRYLRTQWQPLAEVVCVYGCPLRTNNIVESFHNQAKRKLGGLHPNIWKFLELLSNMIVDQGIDLVRARNHERVRRARSVKNMLKDTMIRDAQNALSVDRFTLRQFLARCATRTPAFRTPTVVEDELDETGGLVEPGLLTVGNADVAEPVRRRSRRLANRNASPAEQVLPVIPEILEVAEDDEAQAAILGAEAQAQTVVPNLAQIAGPSGEGNEQPIADNPSGAQVEEEHYDEEDFQLPEDDWENYYPVPDDPVPYYPVEPLEDEERRNMVRARGTCCICLLTSATHAFVECRHQCCCKDCADTIMPDGRCPICREAVTGVLRIISDI